MPPRSKSPKPPRKYTDIQLILPASVLPSVDQLANLTMALITCKDPANHSSADLESFADRALAVWRASEALIRVTERRRSGSAPDDVAPAGVSWADLDGLPVLTQRKLASKPEGKARPESLYLTPTALLRLANDGLDEPSYAPSRAASLVGLPGGQSSKETNDNAARIITAWQYAYAEGRARPSHPITTPFDQRPRATSKAAIKKNPPVLNLDGVILTAAAGGKLLNNEGPFSRNTVILLRILRLFDPSRKPGAGRSRESYPVPAGKMKGGQPKPKTKRGRPRTNTAAAEAVAEAADAAPVHLPK